MLKVGRNSGNDIIVVLPAVSEYHAVIEAQGGLVSIMDNYSTNGVYVNGVRIPPGQHRPIAPGGLVTLGQSCRLDLNHPKIAPLFSRSTAPESAASITIGRDPGNNIVIPEKNVSSRHARISMQGGLLFIEDFSTNGTYINSTSRKVLPNSKVSLHPGDVIFAASHPIVPEQWMPILNQACGICPEPDGHDRPIITPPPIPLRKTYEYSTRIADDARSEVTIGRVPGNDIVIPDPQVSARHARIYRKGADIFIQDLGSVNGTFVDGLRLRGQAQISETSQVRIANQELHLDLKRIQENQIRVIADDTIRLDVDKLVFKVRDRQDSSNILTLLDEISISVNPGEMVAIIGPSGCGKTTFLYSLIGNQPPSSGKVYYNGQNLYRCYDAFRSSIGYVPQEDILFPQLSVQETLRYVCKLRLPPETTDTEIDTRINTVLTSLGFAITPRELDIRPKLIGGPEKKVLSGGQRKRVNIAQELITNPKILFLDEPTSGLASKDAKEVITLLKHLAQTQGVSVVLTIHQPSHEIYSMFDHTVLLCPGGCLAYYGPSVPGSFEYFKISEQNPDRLLDHIDVKPPKNKELKDRFRHDLTYKIHVEDRQSNITKDVSDIKAPRRKFGFRQFAHLTGRNFRLKIKDLWGGTGILLIQAPIIAILILLAFEGKTDVPSHQSVLFLLCVSAIWFGCNNSAREVVSERVIYLRERMVNLKIPSYFMSKMVLMTVLCAFQCLILLAVNYKACKLTGDFMSFFGILVITSVGAVSLGLFLSTLVKSSEAAVGMVPILLVPQVILAGMLVQLGEKEAIDFLAVFAIARWSYEAMLNLEFLGEPSPSEKSGSLIEYLGFKENNITEDLVWMGSMVAVCMAVAMFILYYRDIHSFFQRMKRRTFNS